jgi:hypothetical protein
MLAFDSPKLMLPLPRDPFISFPFPGYGDVAPVTFSGRILTVAWMLTGMYCVGLFGASVTTGLVAESISSSSASVKDTSKVTKRRDEYATRPSSKMRAFARVHASFP